MITSMRIGKVFWVALLAILVTGTLACASDEPAAAPAPTAVSAEAIAQMVGAAVNDAMPRDTGPSADEIRRMIADEMGAQMTAADVKRVVDSAMMGVDSGASAAEIQRMIAEQMGDQMTAEDVKKVVDSAMMGMDTGASAAEIQKMIADQMGNQMTAEDVKKVVDSAMMGMDTGASAAEIQKMIADQMGDQMTAEDVKRVVDSAMMAMQAPEAPKETIIFSDLNWSSAQVQDRIAQYIVDKGYGYPTDVVFGATLPLFQGLRRGDSHVTMEIWLPNQDEAWMEAQAAGEVISVGESLGKDWQSSFVIPAYLQEQYPDLDSVDDLKEDRFKELFATAETGGKARLVSCVIGWACEEVNAKQIAGYGLSDHVHVVNPGDGAAGNADLYGAYEKQEPWLGYQWGTNDPALLLDLVRLEEPAYSDECWFTTKACGYEDATILIAVHPDLTVKAPDVIAMLRKWDFNIEVYKEVAAWSSANPDASTNDAALWWLKTKADLWSGWVTGEAAASINAALQANEIPDGWPTE